EHLEPFWEPAFWCFHSPAWWRRHWTRSGAVSVTAADWQPDGWRDWLLWCDVVAEERGDDFHVRMSREGARVLRADEGRALGFARVVGRRRWTGRARARSQGRTGRPGAPLVVLLADQPPSDAQLLQDQFLDPGRVGLAARGLHDRADQGADRRHLAAADLVRDARVAGDGLLDCGGERALVGDDLQAALLHDLVGRALAREDALDDLAGQLGVEVAGGHQLRDPGDLRGRDGQLVQGLARLVGAAGEFAHPPLAGGGRVGARLDGGDDRVQRTGVEDRL